jgi:hypothetical protein
MADDSPPDRRRHRRIALDASVRLSTIDPEIDPYTGRPFFRAFEEPCANLSRGGVLVHTHEALAPGRRVLVEVALPTGPVFETVARVAWAGSVENEPETRGLGLEFLGGAPRQRERLEKLLEPPPPAPR